MKAEIRLKFSPLKMQIGANGKLAKLTISPIFTSIDIFMYSFHSVSKELNLTLLGLRHRPVIL